MRQYTTIFFLLGVQFVSSLCGQQKPGAVRTIDQYYKKISEDTSIKWCAIPKEQLETFPFVSDAATVYSIGGTIVKILNGPCTHQ